MWQQRLLPGGSHHLVSDFHNPGEWIPILWLIPFVHGFKSHLCSSSNSFSGLNSRKSFSASWLHHAAYKWRFSSMEDPQSAWFIRDNPTKMIKNMDDLWWYRGSPIVVTHHMINHHHSQDFITQDLTITISQFYNVIDIMATDHSPRWSNASAAPAPWKARSWSPACHTGEGCEAANCRRPGRFRWACQWPELAYNPWLEIFPCIIYIYYVPCIHISLTYIYIYL